MKTSIDVVRVLVAIDVRLCMIAVVVKSTAVLKKRLPILCAFAVLMKTSIDVVRDESVCRPRSYVFEIAQH